MIVKNTSLDGVKIITPTVFEDERGYFFESYKTPIFKNNELPINFVQDNEVKSTKGVLRGLHYQFNRPQGKLVRVVSGSILDVAVDIRKGSPTFGQYVSVKLTGENKKQLLVPRGFAHGFVVLEDDTVFAYKVDNYYSPECDRGIAFDDEALNIDWILNHDELNLSAKDKVQPKLNETNDLFEYGINYYE